MVALDAPVRWWNTEPREIFWLEITDRDDLGVDLNAPAAREEGGDYWSYALVREVREGDVVFHYRARPRGTISHWSRAVGEPYADEVFWGAHGQASGRGPVDPYYRPGWRHPLDGSYELDEPVTLDELRALEPQLRQVHERLQAQHPRMPLYPPFQFSDKRPVRPFQGYLTKFPSAMVDLIPELAAAARIARDTTPTPQNPAPATSARRLGTEYRRANPDARTAKREPFTVDPDLVDRALRGHALTQDALADAVIAAGLRPRSPEPGEPNFDIAWDDGPAVVVAEIKSLTTRNEEKQLRLALGQVLRYAHLLGAEGASVRPVIAVEREPSDLSWTALCEANGVTLVWPGTFESCIATDARGPRRPMR